MRWWASFQHPLKIRAENQYDYCGNIMENWHLQSGKAFSLAQLGVCLSVSVSVHMHLCVNACVFAYIHSSWLGIKASYDGMNMVYVWWVLFRHSLCIWVGLSACTRLATRGSLLLSVICIKTRPNYAILRCSLAAGALYLLPKSLRQRYSGLTVCPDTA